MTVLLGYSTAWDRRTVFLIGPIQMVCFSYNVPSSHYHQCTLRYHHCIQSNLIITTIIIGNCDRDNDIRGKNNETETYVDTVSHSCVTQLVGRLWGPGKRQTPMLAVSHYAPWLTSNPPVPLQYPPTPPVPPSIPCARSRQKRTIRGGGGGLAHRWMKEMIGCLKPLGSEGEYQY